MSTLLHLGGQIIALEHIVRAEFQDARPEREWYDEEDEVMRTATAEKARLTLTLSSQHSDEHVHDTDSVGYHVAASSENDVVILRGEDAVDLWTYLENQAVIVNLEAQELDRLVKVPETN